VVWPSVWFHRESVILFKESVFLLDSVPRLLALSSIKNLLGESTEIGVCWHQFFVFGINPGIALAEDKDVVSTSERVRVEVDWLEDDLRVFSWCHVARRTVEVPLWKFSKIVDLFGSSESFAF
jgi:hypothetical protein